MSKLDPSNRSNTGKYRYYETVREVLTQKEKYSEHKIRIGGFVVGDSIAFDGYSVSFHIKDNSARPQPDPEQRDTAHEAASDDPGTEHITVVFATESKPALLQDGIKAIAAGTMRPDGIFYADDLALVTTCTHL